MPSTIIDDAEEVARLKKAGYDGAIHGGNGANVLATEYKVFSENQVKSAIGNRGTFDPTNSDIRFSRSGTAPSPARSPLRDRMERIIDSLIYNFQDRFKPLRDIQKRLVLATEDEDAVLAEERYSGIVRARTNDFHQLDRPRA